MVVYSHMLRYLAEFRHKGISIVVFIRAKLDRFWWSSITTALHYAVNQRMIAQSRIYNVGLGNFLLSIGKAQVDKKFRVFRGECWRFNHLLEIVKLSNFLEQSFLRRICISPSNWKINVKVTRHDLVKARVNLRQWLTEVINKIVYRLIWWSVDKPTTRGVQFFRFTWIQTASFVLFISSRTAKFTESRQ